MSNFLKICTIIGASGVLITAIIYFDYVWRFIIWWPSGWIFLIFTIVLFIIIKSKKTKIFFLLRKYKPGPGKKLLRAYNGKKVYLIINDKTKKWIKNPETLFELGYDLDQAIEAEREELDKYCEEKPISL